MSTPKQMVQESLKLAEQLLQEIEQHKTTNQSKEKNYHPPKWLIRNEILYYPKKKEDKNG